MSARKYVVAWLALLALPAFAWYLVSTGPARGIAFRLLVPESVYLANLRAPLLACGSLSLRRPKVVVIGDSHSYAGWDFARLESGIGRRVGACSLGGLYAETVPLLLDHVRRTAPDVDTVILGLSPRMFQDSPSRKDQLDEHRRLIPAIRESAAPYFRQRFLGEALPYDPERNAIARHASRIEALDEGDIAARLAQSEGAILSLRLWNQRLAESRPIGDTTATVGEICGRVRQHGLRLWVLHVPESPWLESRYPDTLWNAYRDVLRSFSSCAEVTIAEKAVAYGLGNRHFANRDLRDDHDYGSWQRPAALVENSMFDADHLNPVGAAIFTRRILARVVSIRRAPDGR